MLVLARQYLNIWIARPFETSPPSLGLPQPTSPKARPQAYFDLLGAQPVVIFRETGALHLWTGQNTAPLNKLRVEHHWLDQSEARLHITGTDFEQRLTYPIVGEIEDDFITMTDPEDFDFGLFLANVRADLDRQVLLFAPHQTTP